MKARMSEHLGRGGFVLLVLLSARAGAQDIPGSSSWGAVPESRRDAATSPMNARSRVAAVRQALSDADPSGARAFEIDADSEALRGTYRLHVPLLEARGREEPLRIALHYHARMWLGEHEANLAVLDGDPLSAPGWSLNLPKLLGGVLIEADGSRHPARRTLATVLGQEDAEVEYVTTDGSNITYKVELNPPSGLERTARGVVRYPNGVVTVMQGLAGLNENGQTSARYTSLYPTAIVDRHGNVTTIEYRPPALAVFATDAVVVGLYALPDLRRYVLPMRPSRLVDPMGREVNFHYNAREQLTAISLSGNGEPPRTLVRLTYRTVNMYKEIAGVSPAGDVLVNVAALQGIFFPATRTGYWFGEPDSYNNYGMIVNVREQIGMAHFAASLEDAGTITVTGATVRQRIYDYPAAAPATGARLDFPRYRTMTEVVSGAAAPLVTRYEIFEWPGSQEVAITLPDGTIRQLISDDQTGLPRYRETKRADGTFVSSEEYAWVRGGDGADHLAQLTETVATSTGLRSRRAEYTYTPKGFLQDERLRDWVDATQAANAPLLRWTRYSYAGDQRFKDRGLPGLVSRTEVFDGTSLLPEARVDYEYDTLPLQLPGGIERNVFATPAFRPDLRSLFPANAANVRGNLTRVSEWVQPRIPGNTATVATVMSYNPGGPLAAVYVGDQERYRVAYSAAGRFGLPDAITIGSGLARVGTTFTWSLNEGLLKESAGRRSRVTFDYDAARRLVGSTDTRAGGMRRLFSPDTMSYEEARVGRGGATLSTALVELNGFGLPRRIVSTVTGRTPTESFFEYDARGRLSRSARSQSMGSTPAWATHEYDAVGRPFRTILPGGAEYIVDYSRVGAPANVLPTGVLRYEADSWGRGRFIVTDALGRTVQVLEPGAEGAPWTSTRFGYDGRSNLLAVHSDANPWPYPQAGRRFRYDGLSRLTHRYLLERDATLDDGGNVVAAGNWSDRYLYDEQSRLVGHRDPRGVFTSFDYRSDPLDRLFAVRVTTPPGVMAVPDTTFDYGLADDPVLVSQVKAAGAYTAGYRYDKAGRLAQVEVAFEKLSRSFVQKARRNKAGQVVGLSMGPRGTYPVDLAFGYDGSGRRRSVSMSGWNVEATYGPHGLASRLAYSSGGWAAREDFTFDPVTDLLTRQQLSINTQPQLDLQHFYTSSSAPPSPLRQPGEARRTGQVRALLDARAGQVHTFDYDPLARLRLAIVNPDQLFLAGRDAQGFQYAYDGAGNRSDSRAVRYVPPAPQPVVATPGLTIEAPPTLAWDDLGDVAADGQRQVDIDARSNRIVSPGYAYDAAGNVTRLPRKDGSVLALAYDGLGRLARVERVGSQEAESYTYDHQNRLIRAAREDGTESFWLWRESTEATVFERGPGRPDVAHAISTVALAGRAVATLTGARAAPTFIHHTVTGALTSTPPDASVAGGDYRPFGSSAAANTGNPAGPGYHTYRRNRFGLDYAVHRHYDPETGRFLQPDPLAEGVYRLQDPQSLNLYAFTRNDPVNRRDPLGLDLSDECEMVQVDAGWTCAYQVTKTIYQTTVRGKTDAGTLVRSWVPSDNWGWQGVGSSLLEGDRSTEDAIDDGARSLLKKMRDKREKEQRCAAARGAYIAAAQAYARLSAQVAIHNEEVASLESQLNAAMWDTAENVTEQLEDFSAKQAISAVNARTHEYLGLHHEWKAGKIKKALLEMDQKSSIDTLKATKSAQDAACR